MSIVSLSKLATKDDEIRTPARVEHVEKVCPQCKLGRMNHTGRVMQPAPNMPPIYEHVCVPCKHVEAYAKQYPRAEFVKIETEAEKN